MAVDLFRLTGGIRAAFIAGGADPVMPLLMPLCFGIAQAVVAEFHAAEVEAGDPTHGGPMTAPPGGGPVTGKGTIK